MKTLHFRCTKVVHERKTTYKVNEEPAIEILVDCTFECVETADDRANYKMHGYLGITIDLETFQSLNYEVGKVYELAPT